MCHPSQIRDVVRPQKTKDGEDSIFPIQKREKNQKTPSLLRCCYFFLFVAGSSTQLTLSSLYLFFGRWNCSSLSCFGSSQTKSSKAIKSSSGLFTLREPTRFRKGFLERHGWRLHHSAAPKIDSISYKFLIQLPPVAFFSFQ